MLFGIRMIPYGSRYLAEAVVALRRVQELLLFTEVDKQIPRPTNPLVAVEFKNAAFSWDEDTVQDHESEPLSTTQASTTLHNLDLIVEKKRLIGICGPVGSGKSALLHALIGHMVHQDGEMAVGGSVAFVGQSPWIQNLTLRENVLFGESLDKHRYYRVLSACGLTQDVNRMAANDQSEIGERGVTLSGGQKARLSLARALYSNRDIFLIDDILSSIDRSVADHIFFNAIKGLLSGKTTLLVTSDPQRLSYCDEVVYMEAGRFFDHGPHESLLSRCAEYRRFCEVAATYSASEQRLNKVFGDDEVASNSPEAPRTPKRTESESVSVTRQNGQRERTQSTLTAADSLFDIPVVVDGQVTDAEEDLGLAAMSWSVYKRYIVAAGGYAIWILLMMAFLANVSATVFSTVWLSEWIKSGHQPQMMNGSTNETVVPSLAENPRTGFFAAVYALSIAFLFITGLFKAMIFVKVSLNAASRLHNGMFERVIKGSMSFFDSTPSGRILNRFSKDMDEIDVKLPFTAEVFLQNMLTCIAYMIVIIWVFPFFLIASIPLICIFFLFVACFRAGIRSLKRSENVSRSPLFDHISATLDGLSSIHAYNQTDRFLETLKVYLDANSGAVFMFQSAMRWLAVWLDLLVVAITFITAFFIVLLTGQVEPAYAGMALAFAIQVKIY
uniref:Uncharacterized protein n=1 Tax=Plectus sambesii TaxID=2011161 RepID=A0A914WGG6_9BILA